MLGYPTSKIMAGTLANPGQFNERTLVPLLYSRELRPDLADIAQLEGPSETRSYAPLRFPYPTRPSTEINGSLRPGDCFARLRSSQYLRGLSSLSNPSYS